MASAAALPTKSCSAAAAACDCFAATAYTGELVICDRYELAVMLPRIATPSAPPISRVVSFTAEPTPAFSGGSDPMIESVAGAIAIAIPTPSSASTPATSP